MLRLRSSTQGYWRARRLVLRLVARLLTLSLALLFLRKLWQVRDLFAAECLEAGGRCGVGACGTELRGPPPTQAQLELAVGGRGGGGAGRGRPQGPPPLQRLRSAHHAQLALQHSGGGLVLGPSLRQTHWARPSRGPTRGASCFAWTTRPVSGSGRPTQTRPSASSKPTWGPRSPALTR